MSVSLYYTVSRSTPFGEDERRALDAVMDEANATAPEEAESFSFWQDVVDPQPTLTGSNIVIGDDPVEMMLFLQQLLTVVTSMRRAVPDGEWEVHLDDTDVPWDDAVGYTLPGLDDAVIAVAGQALDDAPGADDPTPEPAPPPARRGWFSRWRSGRR